MTIAKTRRDFSFPVFFACALFCFWRGGNGLRAAEVSEKSPQQLAESLLETADLKAGLIAHVGCDDGRLTAALGSAGRYVVHGLDRHEADVIRARHHLTEQGCYGQVSAARWKGDKLPYADGVLNLLVVDDPASVSEAEALRVLAPGAVALVRGEDGWTRREKPVLEATDDWTHYLHGPDNNAVSRDQLVGPPQSIRWVTSFRHLRHHNYLASISAMVSAGGRLFTIEDQGSRMSIDLPSRWRLVARGAFNGIVLWEKPIASWAKAKRRFRSGPLDVSRRLVATEDRLFATLGYDSPVVSLDAATGEVLQTYAGTEGAHEILFDNDMLYLVLSKPVSDRQRASRWLCAIDADSGKVIWENSRALVQNTLAQTLTIGQHAVFLHSGQSVVCLHRESGEVLWEHEVPSVVRRPSWSAPTLVYYDGVLLCGDRTTDYPDAWAKNETINKWMTQHGGPAEVKAFSAETGEVLWTAKAAESFHSPVNIFVIDGLVWFGQSHSWWFGEAVRPMLSELGEEWYQEEPLLGRDPQTGEVRRKVYAGEVFTPSHHHRCYRGKATERFILMGRTGVEFIDVDGDLHRQHHWIRGTCQYGILPANGLLYMPPHPCICYIESKLNGFYAFSADGVPKDTTTSERLLKGKAYTDSRAGAESDSSQWPTYRADPARSGFGRTVINGPLRKRWKTNLGGRLSSAVTGPENVFVAATDRHTVHALDLKTGKRCWSFTTGGRVDSPPTYWRGRVYCGSADGCIYCLDAEDGRLVWRFQAAPHQRLIPAHGQLESAWPVPGSVLVKEGTVYCLAGRSSYIDGGMYFVKLDAMTGEPLLIKNKYHRDPETGQQPPERGWEFGKNALELPGLLQDILSSQGDSLFLRQVRLSESGERIPDYATHLFNPHGFLSDSWWHRSYTTYGERYFSGPFVWTAAAKRWPSGRVLVFDDRFVYGFGREWFGGPGNRGYRLFGAVKQQDREKWKPNWEAKIPVLAFAMALTNPTANDGQQLGRRLFVAGPPSEANQSLDALMGKKGALLLVVDPADGSVDSQISLQAVPIHDGICAADSSVILSMRNGTVVALAGK